MGKSKKAKLSDSAPEQPKVVCFFCDFQCADQGVLIQHQQSKHFKCTQCSGFGGGRCPTHGCRHKCLVTLSCHWQKDHKGECKTIPGAKEGRDDLKKFWRVHGINGTPDDFNAVGSTAMPIPADVGPPIPESELPPMPDQPPMPSMLLPDLFGMPAPIPGQLSIQPLLGLQGGGAIGGVREVESLPPTKAAAAVPDFAEQVRAFMLAKEVADAEEAAREAERIQQQAPPISFPTASASFPIPSASSSSDAFNTEYVTYDAFKSIPEDGFSMEIKPKRETSRWDPEPSGRETMPMSQEGRPRSMERQDRDRRSRSRDRSDRATHTGRGSRSRDRRSRSRDRADRGRGSRSRDRQNSRGAQHHDRERQEERMRDDRGRRQSPERGPAPRGPAPAPADGGGRFRAIAITQGHIPSRIWLQQMMSPYGRLEYSHTGNRLNPVRDPPWVLFATSGSAEDAMKAITASTVVDSNGAPIKGEWKKVADKGKGKSKGDPMEMNSRDLYRGAQRRPDDRGARDGRR